MAAKSPARPEKGKAVLRDIQIFIDGWDTIFAGFVFDVVVTCPKMNSVWRFSTFSHEPLKLANTVGEIPCHGVPLIDGGIIVVECTNNTNGRMYHPSSSTDPYTHNPLSWKLSAQTLQGSSAVQSSVTRAVTDPQWNATGSVSVKESGKIFGFGVESTQTGQVARQGQVVVNTNQGQRTDTTPTLVVSSCELHRVAGRPDLAMISGPSTSQAA